MKGCTSLADAIADCALGEAPEADLAAHLATCPRCEEALRESRAMAARMDLALHRGAAVETPLYGPERAMARIHGRAANRGWWRWAVAGGAVALLLAVVMIGKHRTAPDADVTALSTWRSPTAALLNPPVAAAWSTTPRLGEGLFEIKRMGELHAP